MYQWNRIFIFFLFVNFLFFSCAKKGRPSGGPKDIDAPLLVTANPPYETTNFKATEIKIEFNEFITLKELTKQLVVSPPLKNNPIITPQGTPSKYITIKLMDTLLENSTYIFDFGKSVEDNNEGNQLEKFKYVFSTGNYIDSLNLIGNVVDAFASKTSKNIKLLLYRADSTYKDSLVYKQKPNYVSSTLDTTRFEFSNLGTGSFYIIALEDKNSDYLFNPKTDKIGFFEKVISLPNDSILMQPIKLFREKIAYSFKRAKEESKGKISIGFEGSPKNLNIEPLSKVSDDFISNYKFESGKDTINYWFHNYNKDSIILLIKTDKSIDTTTVKLRKKEVDSLAFSSLTRGFLEFNDTILFTSNNPIISLDTSKIKFFDKDTLKVAFEPVLLKKENKLAILFEKKLTNNYSLELLPNAVKDIFGFTTDTLKIKFATRKLEDYGDITLDVINPENKNLILQLLTDRDVFITQKKINISEKINFNYLRPGKIKIRVINDLNKNGKWDTGNFLNKIKPENIIYYDKILDIRSNWSLNETLTINNDF